MFEQSPATLEPSLGEGGDMDELRNGVLDDTSKPRLFTFWNYEAVEIRALALVSTESVLKI